MVRFRAFFRGQLSGLPLSQDAARDAGSWKSARGLKADQGELRRSVPSQDGSDLWPASWGGTHRTASLSLGVLGLLSSVIALINQPDANTFYRLSFAFLTLLLAGLTVALFFRLISVTLAIRTAFAAYSVCLLLTLNDVFTSWAPRAQSLGVAPYWVAVLYAVAFIAFQTRQAVQACRAIFVAAVLICLVRMGLLWLNGTLSLGLVTAAGLYLLFNSVLMLTQLAVSRLRQQLDQARAVAYTDELTGLPNRRYAQQHLGELILNSQPFSVVTLDIDHFKQINDTHGHETGDRVLRETGRLIGAHLQGEQFMARWGGEEFVLVLPGVGKQQARALAEAARKGLCLHVFGRTGGLSASFGVAEWGSGDDLEAVLRRADAALYAAKRSGRNRVRVALEDGRLTVLDPYATGALLDIGLPGDDLFTDLSEMLV